LTNFFDTFFSSFCRRDDNVLNSAIETFSPEMNQESRDSCRVEFLNIIESNRNPSKGIIAVESKQWTVKTDSSQIFIYETLKLQTEAHIQTPIMMVKYFSNEKASRRQHGEPFPVILLLHPTGGSFSEMDKKGFFKRLASKGFLVVGVDCRYHGERLPENASRRRDLYNEALVSAYEQNTTEHPFVYDNVWDLMRVIDYLQTREDVNPSLIGATGISLGGMNSWFLAFADERVRAVAPAIGVQWFKWAIENNSWHARVDSILPVFEAGAKKLGKQKIDAHVVQDVWLTLCPGILDRFDAPRSLSCIAPRALLILSGEEDPRCPIVGVQAAFEIVKSNYSSIGASNEIDLFVQTGGDHSVSEEMWVEIDKFFQEKLMPKSNVSDIIVPDITNNSKL